MILFEARRFEDKKFFRFIALSALTRRVNKMIVKAVCKLAYEQVLLAFGSGTKLPKHSKGLSMFLF